MTVSDNSLDRLPQGKDPLGQALHQLRLNGSLYCRSRLAGEWSLMMPVLPGQMMFHIITRGGCWLVLNDREPVWLLAGSVALVPHGLGHVICSHTELSPTPFLESGVKRLSDRYEQLDLGSDQDAALTELTCGVMTFGQLAGKQLIQQLPYLLVLEKLQQPQQQWLSSSLEFIAMEAQQLKPGGETIISNLADIIVIQLIRHWLEQESGNEQGWITALKDKHIGLALQAMHHSPDKNWNVEALASVAGLSRSAFSARFTRLVGSSVKQYLTEWRMKLAYQRLQHERQQHKQIPLITLAQELGYGSEAAFSRAFKRVMGFNPSDNPVSEGHLSPV